jgi:hypothetical protein
MSRVCAPASEAVTIAAHGLGIAATREFHKSGFSHWITSFALPNQAPGDGDLIACMTHGQFNVGLTPDLISRVPGASSIGYVGLRAGIEPLVAYGTDVEGGEDRYGENYGNFFSPESVVLRQTACAAPAEPLASDLLMVWLSNNTAQLQINTIPMGQIPMEQLEQLRGVIRY